jgi:hypothetical protein
LNPEVISSKFGKCNAHPRCIIFFGDLLTRVNLANVLDEGLGIRGRGFPDELGGRVSKKQGKYRVSRVKLRINLSSISICPWSASPGPYL